MHFEKLSRDALKKLNEEGYNLLTSNADLSIPRVYWFPEKVENLNVFTLQPKVNGFVLLDLETIIIIPEALELLEDVDFVGEVFMI
ncbi:hypothetical protein ACL9RF_05355 [Sphingobacterium sp. Mn56C]|uniref:hypothetical protein n=1 Tax=Sphingobacterium sp. Mn56C TaxID=3395261 RepID=UPI003BE4BEF7